MSEILFGTKEMLEKKVFLLPSHDHVRHTVDTLLDLG
jgi:hypothetical protein